MAKITIRVGAAADASLRNAYMPLVAAANLARQQVAAQMRGLSTAQIRESDRASRAQARAANEAGREAYRAAKAANDAIIRERQKVASFELREFDKKIRASKRVADAEEKDILRVAAAAIRAEERKAKAAKSASEARRKSVANEFGGRAVSNVANVYTTGKSMGREMLGSAGDISIGGNMTRARNAESAGARATLSGFQAKGSTATPEDVAKTMAALKDSSNDALVPLDKMADGLEAFVTRSSDLESGKAMLVDLGKLANATGSDFTDLARTAGGVSKSLDPALSAADRAEQTMAIMRNMAQAGADGSVELKDMGQYGGRIVAGAGAYSGDAATNIAKVMALAQIAMESGGATDAAEATNSAANFSRDLKKSTNAKKFKDKGIELFEKDGNLRGPDKIILDTLKKTKGDQLEIAKLFPNATSARPVNALAKTYRDAGGGDEGLRAVQAKLDQFSKTLSTDQVQKSFDTFSETGEATAIKFQNTMTEMGSKLNNEILPLLARAMPDIAKLTKAFADMVAWATANPFKAVAIALGASIAKAGIETIIATGIKNLLERGGGGAPVPGGGGKPGAVGFGGGIAAALVGAATFEGTRYAVNAFGDAYDKSVDDKISSDLRVGNARLSSSMDEKKAATRELEQRIANVEDTKGLGGFTKTGPVAALMSSWLNGGAGKSMGNQMRAQQDNGDLGRMYAELGVLRSQMAEMNAGLRSTLKVEVTNQPGGPPGGGIDEGGRTK